MLAVRVEALESSAGVTVGANREVHSLPRSGGIGVLGAPWAGYVELFVCALAEDLAVCYEPLGHIVRGIEGLAALASAGGDLALGGVVNHADVIGEFLELLWCELRDVNERIGSMPGVSRSARVGSATGQLLAGPQELHFVAVTYVEDALIEGVDPLNPDNSCPSCGPALAEGQRRVCADNRDQHVLNRGGVLRVVHIAVNRDESAVQPYAESVISAIRAPFCELFVARRVGSPALKPYDLAAADHAGNLAEGVGPGE